VLIFSLRDIIASVSQNPFRTTEYELTAAIAFGCQSSHVLNHGTSVCCILIYLLSEFLICIKFSLALIA
jgi:hypothetical protein